MAAIFARIPLIGWLFRQEEQEEKQTAALPPAKVAIIGGGVGGCSAAYFLKKNGGEGLDIHVFNDGNIGGRCAVVELDGKKYEAGASVIHTSNKYLVDFREEFGLKEYSSKKEPTTPMALYNGQRFVLSLGFSSLLNNLKLFWNYGLSLLKMSRFVSRQVKQFKTIYNLQANGKCYRTVPDILKAMGGERFFQQTQVTAQNYMVSGLEWNERMVDELVCAAMKVNYGQNNQVDAFTTFVSLAGMDDGSLWSVIGGNYQIPKIALEKSGAKVHCGKVSEVTRQKSDDASVKYTLQYTDSDGTDVVDFTDFDVVIVAHPLNLSSVKFNGFSTEIYTAAAKTPYHRTVATFVKGELNGQTFGLKDETYPRSFPLTILGIELVNPPVVFNSVSVNVPVDMTEAEAKDSCFKPLRDQPVRVWKVFSKGLLTEQDKSLLFRKIEDITVKDWLAYPEYDPPEEFPPFVLDDDGLMYINGIEKAASAMEMSAIGAMNVALLAKEYIMTKKKNN